MTHKRFAWTVIYLNLPLLIAIIILAFVFGQWLAVKILLGVNVVLLLASVIWSAWPKRRAK